MISVVSVCVFASTDPWGNCLSLRSKSEQVRKRNWEKKGKGTRVRERERESWENGWLTEGKVCRTRTTGQDDRQSTGTTFPHAPRLISPHLGDHFTSSLHSFYTDFFSLWVWFHNHISELGFWSVWCHLTFAKWYWHPFNGWYRAIKTIQKNNRFFASLIKENETKLNLNINDKEAVTKNERII